MRNLAIYGAALIVFVALDFLWLGLFMAHFYQAQIGPLLLARGRIAPAIAFYGLYLVGVVVFVVRPALKARRWTRAAGLGALFGLVAYSCYDLTNLATLKGFTPTLALVDLAWGAVVTAAGASAGYAAGRALRV
jgi:uncharacterized membrane protein